MKQILSMICFLCSALPVWAGVAEDAVQVRVLEGWRTNSGTHMAAIELRLADGWKTYWRAPGDAGIPPRFTWDGVENVTSIKTHWPIPETFETAGQRTLGYGYKVVIPVEMDVKKVNRDIRLKGTMDIGVCDDICLPVMVEFDQILPANGKRNAAILAALADSPLTASEAEVQQVTCAVAPQNDGISLTVNVTVGETGGEEIVVIEHPDPSIWVAQANAHRKGRVLSATSRILSADGSPITIDRSKMRFTVLGTDMAVDIRGCTRG